MQNMKALVIRDIGKIELCELPIPKVTHPYDVLLKVSAVGICGSDLKILEGKHHYRKDIALGHEFCGTVIEIGTHVTHVQVGDRVAIDPNIRCGFCTFCRMGLTSQCVEIKNSSIGVMQNGGYAEYCLVPERQCFVLPDEIDDILGTQVETLATVVNGMNHLLMLPYDYVMILGFGPIGYLFAQFARNIAAKVAVTEVDPFRINIAKKCGLTVWNPLEEDVVENITQFTHGRKADIVVEATGNALEQALKCVTPGGKVLPFGMDSSIQTTVVPNDITRYAIKILGLYLGQNTMLPSIRIFQEHRLNMEPFFTKTIPLEHGIQAFSDLGLNLETLAHHPKSAMKIVMKV
ncbi:MAG TPA: alcohol dehydrogenase catalytic domain-containing protein [Anaerolineales bacterium]|nr:alcohol dehydrogenase catalytic domain-containing protein [Anaerolineales bacterium]